MPQVGWIWGGELWSHKDLMAHSSRYPESFPYTPEMLEGMFQRREREYISPTMLSSCPRQLALRNLVDYYVDPAKMYPAYRGTIAHAVMEQGRNEVGALLEQRLECHLLIPGEVWASAESRPIQPGAYVPLRVCIKGQPDKVLPEQKLLIDYKTIHKKLRTPKHTWIWQLSCYRWMLDQHGMKIDRAFVQAIHMEEPIRIEVPLKPLAETEEYLINRVARFLGVFDGRYTLENLPPVLDFDLDSDQAWMCRPEGVPGGGWCPVYDICMDLARKGV